MQFGDCVPLLPRCGHVPLDYLRGRLVVLHPRMPRTTPRPRQQYCGLCTGSTRAHEHLGCRPSFARRHHWRWPCEPQRCELPRTRPAPTLGRNAQSRSRTSTSASRRRAHGPDGTGPTHYRDRAPGRRLALRHARAACAACRTAGAARHRGKDAHRQHLVL